MSSLNKIILVGTLEDNAAQKVTTSGHSVVNFKLKVPRMDNSAVQKEDIFDIVCWNELAEQSQSFQAGQTCIVEGRIVNRSYETDMGQRKYITEIEARKASILGNTSSNNADYQPFQQQSASEPNFEFDSTPDIAKAIQDSADAEVDVPF